MADMHASIIALSEMAKQLGFSDKKALQYARKIARELRFEERARERDSMGRVRGREGESMGRARGEVRDERQKKEWLEKSETGERT